MRAFEHIMQFVLMWGEQYPIETALLILTMSRSKKQKQAGDIRLMGSEVRR